MIQMYKIEIRQQVHQAMHRTFFYTQIKPNDFKLLKEFCQPFSKDIFSADQEHIVAFEQSAHACKAAIKFLNHIYDQESRHDYKIVLVHGALSQDRPEDLPIRIARSIHQGANSKNLIFTEDVLGQINMSDIVFEQKKPMFVKALQKEIPTFSLSRFEESELHIDPTDLFDFSQVDSYSTVDQIRVTPDGQPIKSKDPFESSNTTIEIDPIRSKVSVDTSAVNPITAPQKPYIHEPQKLQASPSKQSSPKIPTSPRMQPSAPKGQIKSIAIILMLVVLVTGAGFYLSKSKTAPSPTTGTVLPVPEIPSTEPIHATMDQSEQLQPSTEPPQTQNPTEPVASVGYLHITSSPSGASIWVNGKKIKEKTPLEKFKVTTLYPVEIEVSKPGYNKAFKKIALQPKEAQSVMFQLTATTPSPKKKTTSKSAVKLSPKEAALKKAKDLSNQKTTPKKSSKKN